MPVLEPGQRPGSTRTLLKETDGAVVRRTVLPGGLRVITESVPGVRSVAFGVWSAVGSRDETPRQAGCSHYLEHLLFKGTGRRSALEISSALDAVGGEMNAFTTKEYTCFYARVLDTDLPLAVDVVSDMITDSLLVADDVDNERGVILEEIAMSDDDPADSVHDLFGTAVFGNSPLGRPVLGTTDSINGLSRRTIDGYYRKHYTPPGLVITAAGSLDHDVVVRQIKRAFKDALSRVDSGTGPAPVRSGPGGVRARRPALSLATRPTEQANLVLGMPGLSRDDDRRFALGVLNAALGGGMSSRLFQEIREKRGLAYSVYSYNVQYAGAGLFGVYVGCQPKRVDEVVDLARTQLADVAAHGIDPEELRRGQGQLKGQTVLGLEDTGSRMVRLGKAELVSGELLGIDDLLARIDSVTQDDIREVAAAVFEQPSTLAVVGPFDEADLAGAVA